MTHDTNLPTSVARDDGTSSEIGGDTSFSRRHIGTTRDQTAMLASLGYESPAALVRAAMPTDILTSRTTSTLPAPAGEAQVLSELRAIAAQNTVTTSLIGQGYYGTTTPAVIRRNIFENPSWYTAYTPYQPEISQGRLEALLVFQTMIAEMTGLHTANASLLDEGTAVVEAMLLARRATRVKTDVFAVDEHIFAQTRAVLTTRADAAGIALASFDPGDPSTLPAACFGCVVQYPSATGEIIDPAPTVAAVHAQGGLAVVAADLLALALLPAPGDLGADIAVGTTQRFGVPMGFGGPHAGYMAVTEKLVRKMPGRLVGVSRDAAGNPAYRLTLQTREQHIRRERATSNICTAQVLLAIMAGMFAVWHGPEGIRAIATRVAARTATLADALRRGGRTLVAEHFFDTVAVRCADADEARGVVAAAARVGIDLWRVDAVVQCSLDETTTAATVAAVAKCFDVSGSLDASSPADPSRYLGAARESDYLTDRIFHRFRSETSMMRYLKRLADRDYALDRGMIPLGSCTMKLNGAALMEATSWPEFANLHPFAPRRNVQGYLHLIDDLKTWLADLTGYDAVTLQPNAGSQGELTGLLAIRGYHRSRGEEQRTVCLIPSSAHGTNAASAVLAGFGVTVVECDEHGSVDLDDLRAKIAAAGDRLGALMVTYPSTHGAYEASIREICDTVHAAGGQVYIDGANFNALAGYARLGEFGGDVSHLNLHKTFAIPHGGGGPGVGPVAVKSQLAPFLPSEDAAHTRAVSAAVYGSAGVLPISWAYLRAMGDAGLRAASAGAVLGANYLAAQLADAFPILYTGAHGLVAHECILDVRPLTARTGITVDDVAKRLNDFGFHAPTMSFPVHGTLMVEPTESEDLGELNRFIVAMRTIRHEADEVAAGRWPADDNPLVNAPHTAASLVGEWTHPYARDTAVYPYVGTAAIAAAAGLLSPLDGSDAGERAATVAEDRADAVIDKYWPPVGRVDNVFGDRHPVCSCPPPEAFETALAEA